MPGCGGGGVMFALAPGGAKGGWALSGSVGVAFDDEVMRGAVESTQKQSIATSIRSPVRSFSAPPRMRFSRAC